MKSQQIHHCVLVAAVTALLVLTVFIGGCHGLAGRVSSVVLENIEGVYYGIHITTCVDRAGSWVACQVGLQSQLGVRPSSVLGLVWWSCWCSCSRGTSPRLLSRQVLKLRLARRGHNVTACRTLRVTGSLLAQYPE